MSESDNSDYEPIPDDQLDEDDTPPDEGEAAVLADIWGSGPEEKEPADDDQTAPTDKEGRDLFSPTTEATADLELMRLKSKGQVNGNDIQDETGEGEEQEVEEDDEQNTPEEVEAQTGDVDANGEPPAKRSRQALTRLPLSRIKTMLKNFDPEWKGQSADAAVALILVYRPFYFRKSSF